MAREYTRRKVLQQSGIGIGMAATGAMAGCLDSIPFVGGGALGPKKWVGAADTFGDEDHGSYRYSKPKGMLDNEDHLADGFKESLENEGWRNKVTGIDPEDVQVSLYAGASVWKADYNEDDVIGELEDNDFDDDTDHEGFTVYVADEESDYAGRAIGVSGDKLVFGRKMGDNDAGEVVEMAIDVGKGNEDRYADENEDMKTLMNKLGTRHYVSGSTQEAPSETDTDNGVFEDNTATGFSWKVDGETSNIKVAYVFDDSDAADKGDVEDYVEHREDQDGTFADANEINVNKDGNAIVIDVDIDTDDVFAE